MKKYFETAVKHTVTLGDGISKKVTDSYLVDAMSFTEAEARTAEFVSCYYEDYSIIREKISTFSEVLAPNNYDNGIYYNAKVSYIILDEKSGKEKKLSQRLCVYADTPNEAIDIIEASLKNSMTEYVIEELKSTNITDIIAYEKTDIHNSKSSNG